MSPGVPNAAVRVPNSSRAYTTAKMPSATTMRLRLCSRDSFFLRFFFFFLGSAVVMTRILPFE